MTHPDSSHRHRDDGLPRAGDDVGMSPSSDLPKDLLDLDRSLHDLLAPTGRGEADAALVERILTVTKPDLPARVLPFEAAPVAATGAAVRFRRFAAGFGAVAAAVVVAIFAGRLFSGTGAGGSDGPGSTERTPRLAAADGLDAGPGFGRNPNQDPLEALDLLETRDSEAMLVAVLDPTDDWFEDDVFAELDAQSVLRSRAFGLDELEGSVFAMLGGPTS